MRAVAVAAAVVMLASACGDSSPTSSEPPTSSLVAATSSGEPDQLSALDDPFAPELPTALVDPEELRSGGPPPDGIPAIDEPAFDAARDVDYLGDTEPVLALTIGDDARAYPLQIMTWHEIVNDEVGAEPVTITYCPLCNSAVAYRRTVGDRVLDFGTSGKLYNSSLVMYDRQTESLWSHYNATAIAGVLTGTELETIPVQIVGWAAWRDAHPDGLVLSRDTGHDRDYGRNPYPGYDDVDDFPFLYEGEVDGRYPAKTRVVGIRRDDVAVAIPLDHLADQGVVEFDAGSTPLVAWHQTGAASALDARDVASGRDIGMTGVFVAVHDGTALQFAPDGEGFVDAQTSSTWNLFGVAVSGPLAGTRLEPVEHLDTFWFAWIAFRPASQVIDN